jgi:hypothetical protein
MPIYLALPLLQDSGPLDRAVTQYISSPSDRYQLQSDRGWLIKFSGTTVELSNHIKITGQPQGMPSPVGSAIVIPVSGYYGRGPSDMWEWLKTRLEQ